MIYSNKIPSKQLLHGDFPQSDNEYIWKNKKTRKKKERKESKQLYAKGKKVFELKDLYRIQVS